MGNVVLFNIIQALLITFLVYLAYVDLRTFKLPDVITIPLIACGVFFNSFSNNPFTNVESSFLGAALGFCSLWLINYLYRYIKKQNGIGMGDAKLLAGLGAWFGWQTLPAILLIASLAGILGGIVWLYWNQKDYKRFFPFGPFLAFAGIIQLLWPQLLQFP